MILDRQHVENLIPHRDPMLFVDAVLDYKKSEFIQAEKTFSAQEEVFKGHFPGHPVLPGVFVVEALAQASAVLVNLSQDKTADESLFFFMSVESAKFRAPVLPDQKMNMKITLERQRGDVYKFKGVAEVGGKAAAEAMFTAKWAAK